jgi:hypothetical protein
MGIKHRRAWRAAMMIAGSVMLLSVLLDDRAAAGGWLTADAVLPFAPLIGVLVFTIVAIGSDAGLGH